MAYFYKKHLVLFSKKYFIELHSSTTPKLKHTIKIANTPNSQMVQIKYTISRVPSLSLGFLHATGSRSRVNLCWLPDDETILYQLPNVLACIVQSECINQTIPKQQLFPTPHIWIYCYKHQWWCMAVSIVSEIEATKIQRWNTKTKSNTNEDEFYNSYKNYFFIKKNDKYFTTPPTLLAKKTNSFINFFKKKQ